MANNLSNSTKASITNVAKIMWQYMAKIVIIQTASSFSSYFPTGVFEEVFDDILHVSPHIFPAGFLKETLNKKYDNKNRQ